MGVGMELRHLRYFVAVAEEGSLTVAAERKLHTHQPSLIRQLPNLQAQASDHRLAALKAISPGDLAGETFATVSDMAPVLRVVIDNYLKQSGINITPDHEADHLAMGMSLIASTRGVGLLPAYAQSFLPRSVTSRLLKGDTPTIDLVFG